ncbi:TPA: hypothetical protein VEO38_003242 [Providencia alcalifaciens]|nr:hypothetical protein [Providencia alcalifaciens]
MRISINLNNSNAIKIKERQQSIQNRLNKLDKAKEQLYVEMIKWETNGGMTDFQNIDQIFDDKLNTLKKNTSTVGSFTESRLNTIEKQFNKLKEKEFSSEKLQAEINRASNLEQPTEAALQGIRKQFEETFLVSKIELKTKNTIPDSFRLQIVKINNEITHINNALVDIRELGDEMTKEYNTARLDALKDAYQQKLVGQTQSIVEVIAGFNVSEIGNMALEHANDFNEAPSYRHINCLGRTAFC